MTAKLQSADVRWSEFTIMVENAMAMVGVTQMRNRSDPVGNGPSDRFERKKLIL